MLTVVGLGYLAAWGGYVMGEEATVAPQASNGRDLVQVRAQCSHPVQ